MNNLFLIPSKYEKINFISNGFYIIETKITPNKALNIIYDYNKKINTINLNKIKDKYSQVFYIEYQKDNFYLIKSILTNSFLEISEGINNRFPLSFNEKIEGDNQKWYIISNTNDYYFIVSKNDSKCVIDVNTDKVKIIYMYNVIHQMEKIMNYLNLYQSKKLIPQNTYNSIF